mmetsp:Transcript_11711/g.19884  ORF Transcript_11711/g.19884 Transcript_11711/m.19884 type:complete len:304 (+) Transcript_11711:187-1098(+)
MGAGASQNKLPRSHETGIGFMTSAPDRVPPSGDLPDVNDYSSQASVAAVTAFDGLDGEGGIGRCLEKEILRQVPEKPGRAERLFAPSRDSTVEMPIAEGWSRVLARFEAVEEHSELARLRENFHEIGQDVFYLSEEGKEGWHQGRTWQELKTVEPCRREKVALCTERKLEGLEAEKFGFWSDPSKACLDVPTPPIRPRPDDVEKEETEDGLFTSVTSSQSSLVLAEAPQGMMIAGTVMHAGTTLKLVVPESDQGKEYEIAIPGNVNAWRKDFERERQRKLAKASGAKYVPPTMGARPKFERRV